MKMLKYEVGRTWTAKGERDFTKKGDEWWNDEAKDIVERKKKVWQDYKTSTKLQKTPNENIHRYEVWKFPDD